jgi:phage gp36-like protein
MYSLTQDVRLALTPGAVSSDKTTAAGLDENQLIDAINQADAKINGYVPDGYTVPMVTLPNEDPEVVVQVAANPFRFWSRDIAAYLATLTFKRNADVTADDPVRLRYEATMADLLLVRQGDYTLPPSAGEAAVDGEISIHNLYEGNLFGPSDFALSTQSGMRTYEIRTHDGSW